MFGAEGDQLMGATSNFFQKKKKWSIIKDDILAWYLTPYIAKILFTRRPLILVDCFAGKGKFDDGNDGSPLIIAKKIQEILNEGKYSQIQGIFIEKKYSKDLKANLAGFNNCKVIEGTFEDNFERILLPNKNANAFIYIDPYGIKSLDFSRFLKLKSSGSNTYEILMNFNTFGFLREGCRLLKYNYTVDCPDCDDEDEVLYENEDLNNNGINLLNAIADGDYWQEILSDYQNKRYTMFVAEELFVKEYVKRLKNKGIFRYTTTIPVTLKTKNIPKYRLIFGTNHHEGLILMCNNMNKQWKHIVEEQRNGQMVLFEYDYPDRNIIKDFDVPKGVISILEVQNGNIKLEDLYCKLIEQYGIAYSESDYSTVLKGMVKEQKVIIDRIPSTTPTGQPAKSFDYTKYKIGVRLNR